MRVSIYKCNHFLVYFLIKGSAGYVLPRLENKCFLKITPNNHFGHSELANESSFTDMDYVVTRMSRQLTIMALGLCELFTLNVKDLSKMKLEFPS
jgi:hypothetical protein